MLWLGETTSCFSSGNNCLQKEKTNLRNNKDGPSSEQRTDALTSSLLPATPATIGGEWAEPGVAGGDDADSEERFSAHPSRVDDDGGEPRADSAGTAGTLPRNLTITCSLFSWATISIISDRDGPAAFGRVDPAGLGQKNNPIFLRRSL